MKMSRRKILKSSAIFAMGAPVHPMLKAAELPGTKLNGKAKAIIEIWMWGGPSHLDTFDPKPEAGSDYTGPYTGALETNVPGIRLCTRLPLLAKQADKFSIIRSMTHGNNGHETATYMMQTGHDPGDPEVYPCVGAVAAKFLGLSEGDSKVGIPNYIALTSTLGRFSPEGFLGSRYKPFATGGNPADNPFLVEGIVIKGITEERQKARRALLHDMNSLEQAEPDNPEIQKIAKHEDQAYEMILGEARDVFDLSKEDAALREKYGANRYGQSCLMARRLVENGAKYVSINAGGWDTHKSHFPEMNRKLPEMDAGIATLLEDLSQRGLLDSTIVFCTGEFGRSPKVAMEAPWNGGRHHFGAVFSVMVAGGGFKGGQVVGSSDKYGQQPADRPVYVQDLHASFYTLMGIDPKATLATRKGVDIPFCEPSKKGKGLLTEII